MHGGSKLLLAFFCLLAVAPLAWHGVSSLKSPIELTRIPPTLVPADPTLENYVELFGRRPFARYYANSFVIAALSSLLCVGAAAIDGLSRFQTFTKIIIPVSTPGLATTGILAFIFAWNEFMLALTFLNMESVKTITVGVVTLSGAFTYEIPWGLLAAGVMASSLPLIVFVLILQKRIVAGLTAGAAK